MTRRRTHWRCPRCTAGVTLPHHPDRVPPCCPCGGRPKQMTPQTEEPEEATR